MTDELTDAQVAELRADLDALAADLDGLLANPSDRTATVTLDQAAVGRVSRIDAIQQQKMAQAQERRHRLRRQQVAQALTLFEDDEYGLCRRCEEPIAYKRLKARPETPSCVACQTEIEAR